MAAGWGWLLPVVQGVVRVGGVMLNIMKLGKPGDAVTVAMLADVMRAAAAEFEVRKDGGQFICPETGRVLDHLSIRKYTQALYPDRIPAYKTHDLARERKKQLLAMADQQERQWGGARPPGAEVGEGR